MSVKLSTGAKIAGALAPLAIAGSILLAEAALSTSVITARVSISSGAEEASTASSNPSINDDGRFIAFASTANNLVSDDTNIYQDIFVHDWASDQTERVSISTAGLEANGDSANPSISGDGRFVVFESTASNLVPGDNNNSSDIFLHDRETHSTTRVSLSNGGQQADRASVTPVISSDGNVVAFISEATNIIPGGTNAIPKIFTYDIPSGTSELISVTTAGASPTAWSYAPSINADGSIVAFESDADDLVSNDNNFTKDVFVRNRGAQSTELISVALNSESGDLPSYLPDLSGDGRYVAFYSYASDLVSGDANFKLDIFLRDRQNQTTQRINLLPDGSETTTGHSFVARISEDGNYIVFESLATDLVPEEDNNTGVDIFLADTSGSITRISVDSNGNEATGNSYRPVIDNTGDAVAFFSDAPNLVNGDANSVTDVFIRGVKPEAPVDPAPELLLTKRIASGSPYAVVGDVISYSFDLENTGNVTLDGPFIVFDDLTSDESCPTTSLAPGDTLTCTASYSVNQLDIDGGFVTNNAFAEVIYDGTTITSNPDSAIATATQNPGLTLTKSAVSGSPYSSVGETISYTFLLENSGNVTLNGPFTVVDDLTTDESCPYTPSLSPGDTITCTASYTVSQADIDSGSVTNSAYAGGSFLGTPVMSNTDSFTAPASQNAELNFTKTISGSGNYANAGDLITYSFELENTGNGTLQGPFVVVDDLTSNQSCPNTFTLVPDQSLICSGSYTVTQTDVNAGSIKNIAYAQAEFNNITVTSNSDGATATANQNPALTITKSITSGSPYDAVGDVIHYQFEVENTGNVTLDGPVGVDDDLIQDESCPNTPSLAPGEIIFCTGSYTIVQLDIDDGLVRNYASAQASHNGLTIQSNMAQASADAAQTAELMITKSISSGSPYAAVGDVITYEFIVENTGNVTLLGPISVVDDLTTDEGCPPANNLSPGDSLICSATYSVQPADLVAGVVTNYATAHGVFDGSTVISNTAQARAIAVATPEPTPVTPTATPVTPTATPVTPTATPVTPTATPVTPTATPVTPEPTPTTPEPTPTTPEPTPTTPEPTPTTPEPSSTPAFCSWTLDFETDAFGENLVRGEIIDTEWESIGILITTDHPGKYPAMIFDSANPTGYDWDLGSPNTDFGGPGRGAGGEEGQPGENRWPLGNVLILSEDGDQDDPDDHYAGGTFIFTFQVPVKIHEVQLLDIDIDEAAGTIVAYDASDHKLGTFGMQPYGNNSVQKVLIDLENVARMEIHLESSGAVAAVSFCDPEPNPEDPTPEVTPEPTKEPPVATKPPNLSVSSCLVKDEDLFRFTIMNNGADGEYRLRAYSGEILGPWPIETGETIGGTTEEKGLSTELEATWLKEYLSDEAWVNAGGVHVTSLQGHAERGYFCNAEGQEPTDEPKETLTPDPSPSPEVTESPQPIPTQPEETPIPSPVVTEDPKSPPTNGPAVDLGPDLSISEGETLHRVGSVEDPDSKNWTAMVDYGDSGAEETLDVDNRGKFSLEHDYGDDGTYYVRVIVTDDQGNSGFDEIKLEVVNVVPEVELVKTDDTGDCKPKGDDEGVKRNYCRNGFWATVNVGDKIEFHASAEDPGSDDLVFTWNSGEPVSYYNNGASPDGNPSPDGEYPFEADDGFKTSFDKAGVHEVSLIVEDDDGGNTEITIRVKVIEVRECVGSLGFWRHQFAENGSHQIDDDELGRYLDLIENKSGYFNDYWGTISSKDAHNILSFSDHDFRAKVRAHLFSAWLNFAKGSVEWDDKIGLDRDTREWRLDRMIAWVEWVLSNSEASAGDFQYAKDLAETVSMLHKDRSKCSYDVSKD